MVGGSVVSSPSSVSNGQEVKVRLTSSSEVLTETVVTVTIGGESGEFSVTTRAGRDDANLSGLSVAGVSGGMSPTETALTLEQAFSAERALYTVKAPNSVINVKVTPTAADTAATIEVSGTAVASGSESGEIELPLREGHFNIPIVVVAEDGATEKRYTLRVTRLSRDAFLSGLSVKVGTEEQTLGRAVSGGGTAVGFDRAATTYTVRVPTGAGSVEVTPTTSDPRATVTVAGGAVSRTAGGALSATTVSLSATSTAVAIVVTPEDTGESAKTYTVTVEKSGLRVRVDPVSLTMDEGGTATYTVVLTAAPAADVTVTPTSGDTGVATVTGALMFSTTTWSTPQTVTVTGMDDTVDNPGDSSRTTVTHAVTGAGSNYEGAVAASVSVSVTDDEITKTLYIEDVEALESAGTLEFKVNLSPAGSSEVTVEWTHAVRPDDPNQATPGTAGAGDYDASDARGTLTFAAGDTSSKTISVPINDDREDEGDEKVIVLLFDPSSSSDLLGISGSPATGTIKNDDGPARTPVDGRTPGQSVFSVSGGGEIVEGDSGTTARAEFTVSLAAAATQQVSVSYATADGTAEAGSDYESVSGTLTFSPGETSQTVTVTVNGDDEAEGDETFSLGLTSTPDGRVSRE